MDPTAGAFRERKYKSGFSFAPPTLLEPLLIFLCYYFSFFARSFRVVVGSLLQTLTEAGRGRLLLSRFVILVFALARLWLLLLAGFGSFPPVFFLLLLLLL